MRSIVVIKRREQGRKSGKAEPNSTTPLSKRVWLMQMKVR
jgi:hypothetical protein